MYICITIRQYVPTLSSASGRFAPCLSCLTSYPILVAAKGEPARHRALLTMRAGNSAVQHRIATGLLAAIMQRFWRITQVI